MGQHKGKKKRDQPSQVRYRTDGHRYVNKVRRIKKCNGMRFLNAWLAKYYKKRDK